MRSKYEEFILNELEKHRKNRKFNFKKWLKYTFSNPSEISSMRNIILTDVKKIYLQDVIPTLTAPKSMYPIFSKAYDRAVTKFSNEENYTLFELYNSYINFKVNDSEDKKIRDYLYSELKNYLLVYCH